MKDPHYLTSSDELNSRRQELAVIAEQLKASGEPVPSEWRKFLPTFAERAFHAHPQKQRAGAVLEERHAQYGTASSGMTTPLQPIDRDRSKRAEESFRAWLRALCSDDASYQMESHVFEWNVLLEMFGTQENIPPDLVKEFAPWVKAGAQSAVWNADMGLTVERVAALRALHGPNAEQRVVGPVASPMAMPYQLSADAQHAEALRRSQRAQVDKRAMQRANDHVKAVERQGYSAGDVQHFKAQGAQMGAAVGAAARDIRERLHKRALFGELRSRVVLDRIERLGDVGAPQSSSISASNEPQAERYCTSCGAGNLRASTYCAGCGRPLPAG